MPMYEYRCDSCGSVCERYSAGRGGQDAAERCPSCGKGQLKKVFSTFASACCSSGGGLPSSGGCGGGSGQFS